MKLPVVGVKELLVRHLIVSLVGAEPEYEQMTVTVGGSEHQTIRWELAVEDGSVSLPLQHVKEDFDFVAGVQVPQYDVAVVTWETE